MTPSRPPRRAVLATLVVAGVLATVAGCGGHDEAGGGGTEVTTGPAPAELDAEITTVGSSLRIAWRVTNTADGDLVVGSSRWSMARPRISLARSRCTTRATLKRPATRLRRSSSAVCSSAPTSRPCPTDSSGVLTSAPCPSKPCPKL